MYVMHPKRFFYGTNAERLALSLGLDAYGTTYWESDTGSLWLWGGAAWFPVAGSGAAGHTIEDEGSALTQRNNLNFIGDGVVAMDDLANDSSNIYIPGGAGHVIEEEGAPLTARTNLNFIGDGVTAIDYAAGDASNIYIPGGGHIIQEETADLPARSHLNFTGGGVVATDNAGTDATDITIEIPAGAGHVIQDEGVDLAQEDNLNFVGDWVDAYDDGGGSASVVYIPKRMIPVTDVEFSGGEGSPSYNDLYDFLVMTRSAGRFTGGVASAHVPADGSVDISEMEGMIFTSEALGADLIYFKRAAEISAITPGDLVTTWIYIDYDGGAFTYKSTTDRSTIHEYDQFTVARCFRNNLDVEVLPTGHSLYNKDRRMHNRLILKYGVMDYVSGAILSQPANLKLAVTLGNWYVANTPYTTPANDTSGAGHMHTYYRSGASTWTKSAALTALATTQYNRLSDNSLQNVSQYGVYWIFIDPDGDLYAMYGQANYNNIGLAQAATVPSVLPPEMLNWARLAGKVIFAKNGVSFYSVESAFEVKFVNSVATDHNSLANLNDGDLHHLTAAEYAAVVYGDPAATDGHVAVFDVDGYHVVDGGPPGGGGGHVIEEEGTPLTNRANLNFIGAGVTAIDYPSGDASNIYIPGSVGGGHTIEEEGTPLPARTYLDFIGSGVTAVDDAIGDASKIYIPGSAGGGHTIEEEGVSLPARTYLNFIGVAVTAVDDSVGDASKIYIPGTRYQSVYMTFEGALTVGENKLRLINLSGVTRTITKVSLIVETAPATQAIIADVHKNGTTIFTTQANRPQIAAAGLTGFSTTIEVPSWADGEYITAFVDQAGVGTAGSYLTVHVQYTESQ